MPNSRKIILGILAIIILVVSVIVGYQFISSDNQVDTTSSNQSQTQPSKIVTRSGTPECIYEADEPVDNKGSRSCYSGIKAADGTLYLLWSDKEIPAITTAMTKENVTLRVTGVVESNAAIDKKTYRDSVLPLHVSKAEIVSAP